MSNELHCTNAFGATIYAIIWRVVDGKVWDAAATAWATWNNANIDDYDIPLPQVAGDFYAEDFPTDITPGTRVHWVIYERAGADPAITDLRILSQTATWLGELGAEEIGAGDYITTAERAQRASDVLNGLSAARLTDLLAFATDWLESRCSRTLIQATMRETYDGDGSRSLVLKQFPVDSLTTVTITDDDGTEYDIATDQFRVNAVTGVMLFKPDADDDYTYFPEGFQNVAIVYVAGYETVPDDLQEAAIELMEQVVTLSPGVKGERLGDYAVTFRDAASQMSAHFWAVVARYRDLKLGA